MLVHTSAYLALRSDAQDTINFVVLVCHGMPALNAYMKAVDGGSAKKLPDSDYFGAVQPHAKLRSIKETYRKTLGRFVVLSSQAHFEAYVKDAIAEVFDFHEPWAASTVAANRGSIDSTDAVLVAARNALREPRKSGPEQRYAKRQAELMARGYRFPTDLLSSLGIATLSERVGNLKASQIPDLLRDAFHFDLSEAELASFTRLRDLRNGIAHGRTLEVDLGEAMEANGFLRDLAKRFDEHLVKHFMVLEPRSTGVQKSPVAEAP
jgi:hypothetical protein